MDAFVAKAIDFLHQGQVIAMPTDTVYGLIGRADLSSSIERLQSLKRRSENKAFLILYPSLEEVEKDAHVNKMARQLAQTYWPGPLTMLLPLKEQHRLVSGCYDAAERKVAVRIPGASPIASVLKNLPFPLAAPSANRSGEPTPRTSEGVSEHFQEEQLWVMPGATPLDAQPSTLVSITNNKSVLVVRKGPLNLSAIEYPQSC